MGLQLLRDIHSEVSAQDAVLGVAQAFRRSVSQTRRAEGEPDRGRVFDAWPRAHNYSDNSEVRGVAGDWFYQGQECDLFGRGIWRAQTQIRWTVFLTKRVFCLNSRLI